MQTTEKSKIFLSLLFLVALFFVSCSFEDTLGTYGRNTRGNSGNVETGGDSSSGGNSGSGGTSGGIVQEAVLEKMTALLYPKHIMENILKLVIGIPLI